MKAFSLEAKTALRDGTAIVSGAVWFGGAIAQGFWGGHGSLVLPGPSGDPDTTFSGLGDKGLVEASGGTLGGQEQKATLSLSGVDPEVAATLDLGALRGVPVILWRLIYNGTGSTLLHAQIYLRGRVDTATVTETPGGTSVITLGVEGAARGLGRRSERMRSDADQQLIKPGDTGLKRVSYAGEKVIYFGGKPPVRAGVGFGGVGGNGGGRGGIGGGGGEVNLV